MGSNHSNRTSIELHEQSTTNEKIGIDRFSFVQEERQTQVLVENVGEAEEIDLTPEEDPNLVASKK